MDEILEFMSLTYVLVIKFGYRFIVVCKDGMCLWVFLDGKM